MVYQAVSATTAGKERTYWNLNAVSLITSVLLLIPSLALGLAVLETSSNGYIASPGLRYVTTVLAALGALIAVCWLTLHHRLSREVAHWQGLLRQIEGEFAGAEFHRSALRLLMGQPVRAPMVALHFGEWYPGITHLGWMARKLASLAVVLLPTAFLLFWLALGTVPWVIG